jgi:hypothetical protein
MIIIKKEALSYFYTKREHRKNIVTKVSVIVLRDRHRVTLIKMVLRKNKKVIWKNIIIVGYLRMSATKCL